MSNSETIPTEFVVLRSGYYRDQVVRAAFGTREQAESYVSRNGGVIAEEEIPGYRL